MYRNGRGVTKDDKKAVEWYTKSAEQGHARGQCNLGIMYHNGYGITNDYKKAVDEILSQRLLMLLRRNFI